MTEQTLLAAVHAAANPKAIPAADAASQPQEINMAETAKPAGETAVVKPTTVAELSATFPDLVGVIRTEAKTEERNRIAGIEKNAGKRKGIDELVAAMKADANCTPAMAAERILQHENAKLEAQHANIKGVEAEGSKVNAAPNSGGDNGKPTFAQTPEGWKAEYEASATLQRQFSSAETYVAFKKLEASGRLRILGSRSA